MAAPRIAVIKPVFTTSAYMSFYSFYRQYANVPQNYTVRTDLNLLNATVNDGWGVSLSLYSFIQSQTARDAGIALGNNTFILSDIDLNQGKLFSKNGSLLYNTVILGFEEYVSEREYLTLKEFVLNGGKLIILSGGNFLAEVKYSSTSNTVSLVKGHGWYFNGTAAVKSVYARWYAENTEWVGSNYAYYIDSQHYTVQGAVANTSNPYSVLLRLNYGERLLHEYAGHEENVVTNASDNVIAYWVLYGPKNLNGKVAIYELHVGKGVVYHMGIFGTDILLQSKELQFLIISLLGFYGVDAFVYHSGCETKIVGFIKSLAPPLNKTWIGIVWLGGTSYAMNTLNSTFFLYTVKDCYINITDSTIFVYSNNTVGTYLTL
ncbi:MAG: hypothetical protein QXV32_00305 [Conexivisphaerales archaeon]